MPRTAQEVEEALDRLQENVAVLRRRGVLERQDPSDPVEFVLPQSVKKELLANDAVGPDQVEALPKFAAYHAHASGSYNDGATIVFGTEIYDTASAYSTSTGEFVAPIAGVYHFSWAVYRNNAPAAGVYWQGRLQTTSTQFLGNLHICDGVQFPVSVGSADVQLASGQSLSVKIGTSSGAAAIYGTNRATFFCGHYVP